MRSVASPTHLGSCWHAPASLGSPPRPGHTGFISVSSFIYCFRPVTSLYPAGLIIMGLTRDLHRRIRRWQH
eukprot:453895-Pyramimonas_sp.AAC.1